MTQELLSEMNGNSAVNEILLSEYLKESAIFNLLPYAVYVCEVSGMIVNYNYKATELWGRIPKKGDEKERFSGAYRLYYPVGEHMPHNQTPVAACLKEG